MIGCFPDPYPDEILYSICARYKERMVYLKDKDVFKIFFGRGQSAIRIDIPLQIEYLVSQLPPGHSYSVERFIRENTLVPFHELRNTGVRRRTVQTYNSLKFCPICVQQDKKLYGETYWHRLHQINEVIVCNVHHAFLQESSIPIFKKGKEQLIPASKASDIKPINLLDSSNVDHKTLLGIANDVAWFIEQKDINLVEFNFLRNFYIYLLFKKNYTGRCKINTESYKFDKEPLICGFLEQYSHLKGINNIFHNSIYNNLQTLTCKRLFQENYLRELIDVLILDPGAVDPLHHLLIARMLAGSLEDFLNAFQKFKKIYKEKYYLSFKCPQCEKTSLLPHSERLEMEYNCKDGIYYGKLLCLDCYYSLNVYLSISSEEPHLAFLKLSPAKYPYKAERYGNFWKLNQQEYLSMDEYLQKEMQKKRNFSLEQDGKRIISSYLHYKLSGKLEEVGELLANQRVIDAYRRVYGE